MKKMVDFGAIIGESAEWTKQVLFKPMDEAGPVQAF